MSNITVTEEQLGKLLEEADIQTETRFGKCTVVTVRLKNGFVLTASSACVDPESYSAAMGREICLEQIKDRLWELEAYALQKKVYEQDLQKELDAAPTMNMGYAIEKAKSGARISRKDWGGKFWLVYIDNKKRFGRHLEVRGSAGRSEYWTPEEEDLFAEDWYVMP